MLENPCKFRKHNSTPTKATEYLRVENIQDRVIAIIDGAVVVDDILNFL